jgi:hypothetical protein
VIDGPLTIGARADVALISSIVVMAERASHHQVRP